MGVDANAAGLREISGRAFRAHAVNVVYVRAAIEAMPAELLGIADRVSIILPWGSLLSAVASPSVAGLERLRALCQPAASLSVLLGIDPVRDAAELRRLAVAVPSGGDWRSHLRDAYASAGFDIVSVREVGLDQLARWPSTWARRLAHGHPRPFVAIEARTCRT